MPAFELGSVYYDHYVINIRLPINNGYKSDFGDFRRLNIVVSRAFDHHNVRHWGTYCANILWTFASWTFVSPKSKRP